MTITSFELFSVPVSNQQASKAFYHDVLGFEVVREEAMGPGTSWIQMSPKGCAVTITLVTWLDGMKPGGLQGVMLNTTDIDADHEALTAKGLKLSDIEEQPWGRYAMFSDPDGNGWILRPAPGLIGFFGVNPLSGSRPPEPSADPISRLMASRFC